MHLLSFDDFKLASNLVEQIRNAEDTRSVRTIIEDFVGLNYPQERTNSILRKVAEDCIITIREQANAQTAQNYQEAQQVIAGILGRKK